VTRDTRLNKRLARTIRDAARRMNQAEPPADAGTAREMLLDLHDALANLREPLRGLLDAATAADSQRAGLAAGAERRLSRLTADLLRAAGED
jgi:DNA-binding ferritin-like protein